MLGLDIFPLPLLFMIAAAIALVVNFPNHHDQSERIKAHASSIVAVVAMVFAAAVLVGVLEGTGMVTAMAEAIVAVVPPALGPWFAVITGLLSMPFTFFMSNDAFYFGVSRSCPRLPANTASHQSKWPGHRSSDNPFT